MWRRLDALFLHLFAYLLRCKIVALTLYYYSIASCACQGDVSASAICHLYRLILVDLYIGRFKQVSSRCFGGLSCNSLVLFSALWVQSMNRR